MRRDGYPKILAKRTVASARLVHIEEADLEFQNGERRTYEYATIRKDLSVMAIPVVDHDTILLMREYAVGVDRYELAFPKGVMEEGENPLEAANREMMEEVGFAARKLTLLKELTAIPGYLTGKMYCVIGEDLYPQSKEGDEPELIEVVPWSLSKIDELLCRDDFSESRSVACLLMLKRYLHGS